MILTVPGEKMTQKMVEVNSERILRVIVLSRDSFDILTVFLFWKVKDFIINLYRTGAKILKSRYVK